MWMIGIDPVLLGTCMNESWHTEIDVDDRNRPCVIGWYQYRSYKFIHPHFLTTRLSQKIKHDIHMTFAFWSTFDQRLVPPKKKKRYTCPSIVHKVKHNILRVKRVKSRLGKKVWGKTKGEIKTKQIDARLKRIWKSRLMSSTMERMPSLNEGQGENVKKKKEKKFELSRVKRSPH